MKATSIYKKSPLNYVGGKYKILDQIIPLFPQNINTFVDLFAGGFNVGINVHANTVIYNDVISPLCKLIEYFSDNKTEDIISELERNLSINKLNKQNSEAFLNLRNKYNHFNYISKEEQAIDFYCLILHSFNYQIRFNNKLEYNTPFGKNRSSYNRNTKKNLLSFIDKIHEIDLKILNKNFKDFNFDELSNNDYVYCDPPYLITTGSYNDGIRGYKGWSTQDEICLLKVLDQLNDRGIMFGLSNVLKANARKNDLLYEWSKKYHVYPINNSFNNSNYQRKNKNDIVEVLITNYMEV